MNIIIEVIEQIHSLIDHHMSTTKKTKSKSKSTAVQSTKTIEWIRKDKPDIKKIMESRLGATSPLIPIIQLHYTFKSERSLKSALNLLKIDAKTIEIIEKPLPEMEESKWTLCIEDVPFEDYTYNYRDYNSSYKKALIGLFKLTSPEGKYFYFSSNKFTSTHPKYPQFDNAAGRYLVTRRHVSDAKEGIFSVCQGTKQHWNYRSTDSQEIRAFWNNKKLMKLADAKIVLQEFLKQGGAGLCSKI